MKYHTSCVKAAFRSDEPVETVRSDASLYTATGSRRRVLGDRSTTTDPQRPIHGDRFTATDSRQSIHGDRFTAIDSRRPIRERLDSAVALWIHRWTYVVEICSSTESSELIIGAIVGFAVIATATYVGTIPALRSFFGPGSVDPVRKNFILEPTRVDTTPPQNER